MVRSIGRPGEDAGLANGPLVQRIEQERPQNGTQPVVHGDIEPFFRRDTTDAADWSFIKSRSTNFKLAAADLEIFGQSGREFHQIGDPETAAALRANAPCSSGRTYEEYRREDR